MNPLRSLWLKLLLGFVLVAVVAVGMVAVLANRTTTQQFQIYVSQGRQNRAQRLAPIVAEYYARTGSWTGVEDWLASADQSQRSGQGQGLGRGQRLGFSDERIVLADVDGRILHDSLGELEGLQLSQSDLAFGAPVTLGDQIVGTLLVPAGTDVHESLESGFVRNVNRSLLWAGLAAGAVALALGLLLARQLTAPLRALTEAARHLTQGKLDHTSPEAVPQVPIRTQDELGELSQAFNQMSRSLVQQETLRRNLMADIAHELRTPLSVMRSDLEALLDGVYEPTPAVLASLHDETLLISRLVDDLRSLALAEAGQLHLQRELTDVSEILEGVVAGFEPYAASQNVRLMLDLTPELPPVDVDPQRIRQVFANLISNALRHAAGADQRGETGQVVVSAARKADQIEFSVADNGPGISTSDLDRVFDRFWKGDRARSGNSGLGLAISRELVRAHGGRIWAESAPGQGATFRFVLPLNS